jgi:uncharacterized protein
MYLDLSEIRDAPVSIDRKLTLSDTHGSAGAPMVSGPVSLVGEACRGAHGIELTARVEASVRLDCSRCLEPYDLPVATDFSLRVVPGSSEDEAPGEREVSAFDAEVYPVEGERLDLVAVAREQVLLALPLKPVCEDACQGLCPTCGANRNRIECGCSRSEPDLRLAPLAEIKKRLGGS